MAFKGKIEINPYLIQLVNAKDDLVKSTWKLLKSNSVNFRISVLIRYDTTELFDVVT